MCKMHRSFHKPNHRNTIVFIQYKTKFHNLSYFLRYNVYRLVDSKNQHIRVNKYAAIHNRIFRWIRIYDNCVLHTIIYNQIFGYIKIIYPKKTFPHTPIEKSAWGEICFMVEKFGERTLFQRRPLSKVFFSTESYASTATTGTAAVYCLIKPS